MNLAPGSLAVERAARPAPAGLLAAWALGAALFSAASSAQLSAPTALPDAVKGLRPAGSSCLRDDFDPSVKQAALPEVPAPEPDLGCAVSPADVLAWRDDPQTVVADTRLPSEVSQFSIPGAMALSPSDLSTKLFLRSKRVILVGSGKGDQDLYRRCASLKSQGFAGVKVLRGGMAAWRVAGQPIVGRLPPIGSPSRLDPAELWREAQFGANVVFFSPDLVTVQKHLPSSFQLDDLSAAGIGRMLERRRKELRSAPLASVVLVAGPELTELKFEQIQQSMRPTPVLAYSQGVTALSRQMALQAATWEARSRGPKKPPCGT